ncbi:hypothetical protein KSC_001830 [Ktedonobacter sp. SOSP1-52]|nr:hypothetical protein KSC_001830 [Ktedonobacter sp. SOSP1-52]
MGITSFFTWLDEDHQIDLKASRSNALRASAGKRSKSLGQHIHYSEAKSQDNEKGHESVKYFVDVFSPIGENAPQIQWRNN